MEQQLEGVISFERETDMEKIKIYKSTVKSFALYVFRIKMEAEKKD